MINFLKSDEIVVGNIYKEILPGSGEYMYYIPVKYDDRVYGYSKMLLAFHSARSIKDLLKLKGTPPKTFLSYSYFDRSIKLTPIGDLEPVTVLEDDTLPRTTRLSTLEDGIVYSVHHKGTRWVAEYVLLNDYTLYYYSLSTKKWLKVPYKEVLGIIREENADADVTEAFTYPSLPWEIKGDK